jgi:hypothetical protein
VIVTKFGTQNLLKTATVTASADTANAPNAWDTFLTDFWQPGAGAQTLIIDHGSAKAIDYWGISANLGSDSASAAIAWSDDDISYTTIETINPTTDAIIFREFTSVSHRYTKITITGTAPKIGYVSVGAAVEPGGTLEVPFTPPKHSGKRNPQTNVTENGLPLGNIIKYTKHEVSMSFKNVETSWIDSTWDAFYDDMIEGLFFVMWDSSGRATETAICWLTDDSNPTYQDTLRMKYSLKFNCIL